MTIATLADIATIHGGGRLRLSGNDFVDSGVPAYGAAGLNGYVATTEYEDRDAVILSSIGARCGKCFLVGGSWTSLANTQVILPDPAKADPRFLWYQLNDEGRWHRSGSAQPFIKPSDVKAHRIFLPPLPEQRRIAAILDHADALRAKRRQVLTGFDTLSRSVFNEMFANEPWPTSTLNEVSVIAGEYGANVPSIEPSEDLPRYVRITDITEAGRLNSDTRGPGGELRDWEKYELADGDMLFARSGATVGKAYRYRDSDGPCVFAGYLIRFRPDPAKIDPDYLFGVTRTAGYAAWVSARQNVVAQPNINAKQYGNELSIPLPPIDLQHKYARRTASIRKARARVARGLVAGDALFASLQSRAFRGGL